MTSMTKALKKARILIVDDEPANVVLLERLLKQGGYSNLVTHHDSAQVLGCARGCRRT